MIKLLIFIKGGILNLEKKCEESASYEFFKNVQNLGSTLIFTTTKLHYVHIF